MGGLAALLCVTHLVMRAGEKIPAPRGVPVCIHVGIVKNSYDVGTPRMHTIVVTIWGFTYTTTYFYAQQKLIDFSCVQY
jgi:hypothetical protein